MFFLLFDGHRGLGLRPIATLLCCALLLSVCSVVEREHCGLGKCKLFDGIYLATMVINRVLKYFLTFCIKISYKNCQYAHFLV